MISEKERKSRAMALARHRLLSCEGFFVSLFLCSLLFSASHGADGGDGIEISGAGASFPDTLYQEAAFLYSPQAQATFDCLYRNVAACDPEGHVAAATVKYTSTGSGRGKCRIKGYHENCIPDDYGAKEVDFACSESMFEQVEYEMYPDLQMFPLLAGGVVPIYNIKGIVGVPGKPRLKLRKKVLSQIFRGNITMWDDERILATNSELASDLTSLADKTINVVVRNDPSGTTEAWKTALSHFDPDFDAQIGANGSPVWNGVKTHARERNRGVSGAVISMEQSIGYVVLKDVVLFNLTSALLINNEITMSAVEATKETVKMALTEKFLGAHSSSSLPKSLSTNQQPTRVEYPYTPVAGNISWPITGYSFLLMRSNKLTNRLRANATCRHVEETIKFWTWFLRSTAVTRRTDELGYGRLPETLRERVLQSLHQNIYCDGRLAYEEQLAVEHLEVVTQTSIMEDLHKGYQAVFENNFDSFHGLGRTRFPVKTTIDEACSFNKTMIGSGDLYWGMSEVDGKKLSILPFRGRSESNYYDEEAMDEFLSVPIGTVNYGIEYNVPGVEGPLYLTKEMPSGILLTQIKYWNDPVLVMLNPVLENVTERITIFLPSTFLSCFVDQSDPEDYNDRHMFATAVRMGLFPQTEEVEENWERLKIIETNYSIGITFVPNKIDVMYGERTFFQMVDSHTSERNFSEGDAPCYFHDSPVISYGGRACFHFVILQLNAYIRKKFDVIDGVAINDNLICTKAVDAVSHMLTVFTPQAQMLFEEANLGFVPFSDQIIHDNYMNLNSVTCQNASILCDTDLAQERKCLTDLEENCYPVFEKRRCNNVFQPKMKVFFSWNKTVSAGSPPSNITSISVASSTKSVAELEVDCDYIPYLSDVGQMFCILTGIFGCFQLVLLAWVCSLRRNLFMIAGQPLFYVLMMVGNFIALLFIPLSIGEWKSTGGNVVFCDLRWAFLCVGMTMSYTAIICKAYRIYAIFNNLVPVKVVGKDLLPVWALVVLYDVVGFVCKYLTCESEFEVVEATYAEGTYTSQRCAKHSDVFFVIILMHKVVIMVYGTYLCFNTKKVTGIFSEARSSAILIYNGIMISVTTTIILEFGQLTESERMMVLACSILFCSTGNTIVLVLPRLLKASGIWASDDLKKNADFFVQTWSSGAFCTNDGPPSSVSSGPAEPVSESRPGTSSLPGTSNLPGTSSLPGPDDEHAGLDGVEIDVFKVIGKSPQKCNTA